MRTEDPWDPETGSWEPGSASVITEILYIQWIIPEIDSRISNWKYSPAGCCHIAQGNSQSRFNIFQTDRGCKPGSPKYPGVWIEKEVSYNYYILISSFWCVVPNTALLKHSHELTELNDLIWPEFALLGQTQWPASVKSTGFFSDYQFTKIHLCCCNHLAGVSTRS